MEFIYRKNEDGDTIVYCDGVAIGTLMNSQCDEHEDVIDNAEAIRKARENNTSDPK